MALRQITTNASRVAAIMVAVAIGTAYVSASFIYAGSVRASITAALTNGLSEVDAVVSLPEQVPVTTALNSVTAIGGVTDAYSADAVYGSAPLGGGTALLSVAPLISDVSFQPISGRLPTRSNEVAISDLASARSHFGVGDTIEFTTAPDQTNQDQVSEDQTGQDPANPDQGRSPTQTSSTVLRIVGVVPASQSDTSALELVATPETVNDLTSAIGTMMVLTTPKADVDAVLAALQRKFPTAQVYTGAAYATQLVDRSTTSMDEVLSSLLLFAAIAIFVLVLVVRNTFTVLIAQRSRHLALLRCIGASSRQLRALTLIEAAVIGLGASLVGVATGVALMALAIGLIDKSATDLLPDTLSISAIALLVPLLVGVAVTVFGAIGPAREAARLHPLLALDAIGAAEQPAGVRRRILVVGLAAFFVGTAGMLLGILVHPVIAMGGGMVSALGVLALSSTVVPALARLLGRFVSGAGASLRLAAANAVRNPARTAATSGALIVGVGLITMMSIGASTIKASADDGLTSLWPVDVTVSSQAQGLDQALVSRLKAVKDLGASAQLRTADGTVSKSDQPITVSVLAADSSALSMLPKSERPGSGQIALGDWAAETLGVMEGQPITVKIGSVTIRGTVRLVSYQLGNVQNPPILIDARELGTAMRNATIGVLWLNATNPDSSGALAVQVNDEVGPRSDVSIASDALDRGSYADAINGALLISTALIAIAVLIAIVGVGNTISLSVFERRREIGMLRAIGMTRHGVRAMVSTESVLIAAVGIIVGLVIGIGYGWAGANAVLGPTSLSVQLQIPWVRIGIVVAVTLVAALAAAALPARSAGRVSPTTALAAT